jgi:hypothetical protein
MIFINMLPKGYPAAIASAKAFRIRIVGIYKKLLLGKGKTGSRRNKNLSIWC